MFFWFLESEKSRIRIYNPVFRSQDPDPDPSQHVMDPEHCYWQPDPVFMISISLHLVYQLFLPMFSMVELDAYLKNGAVTQVIFCL
jgi:hypothetical protein